MGGKLSLDEMSELKFGKFSENVKVTATVRGISNPIIIPGSTGVVYVGLFLQQASLDFDKGGDFLDAKISTTDYKGLVSLLARLNAINKQSGSRIYASIIVGGNYNGEGLDIEVLKISRLPMESLPSSRDYYFR